MDKEVLMFAKRLINLRENRNLYQKDIAKIFNVEQATVSNWEKGKRIPDSDTLIKIANYFNVSIDYLLGNENKMNMDREMEELEVINKCLQRIGYLDANEELSKREVERIMRFIMANKEFLKENK